MFRTLLGLVMALAFAAFANGAAAQVTYNFQGGFYDTFNNNTTCTVGECATHTAAHQATASVTFAGPLAPNLVNADVSLQVTSFSFTDGVTPVTTGPGPNGSIANMFVTTNGAGVLTDYVVVLQRTPGPPYAVNAAADPNSRITHLALTPLSTYALANAICWNRGPLSAGSSAGSCDSLAGDTDTSGNYANTPTTFTTNAPATVPTLSEWAMILFGVLLAGGAALRVQRQRMA